MGWLPARTSGTFNPARFARSSSLPRLPSPEGRVGPPGGWALWPQSHVGGLFESLAVTGVVAEHPESGRNCQTRPGLWRRGLKDADTAWRFSKAKVTSAVAGRVAFQTAASTVTSPTKQASGVAAPGACAVPCAWPAAATAQATGRGSPAPSGQSARPGRAERRTERRGADACGFRGGVSGRARSAAGASPPLPACFLPRVSVSEDGSLTIRNATRADAGPYTCTATNPFGVAKDTGGLVVKGTLASAGHECAHPGRARGVTRHGVTRTSRARRHACVMRHGVTRTSRARRHACVTRHGVTRAPRPRARRHTAPRVPRAWPRTRPW